MSKFDLTVDAIIFRKNLNELEVLLIERKNYPFKGKMALPGGFINKGERFTEAVARELQEETNLNLDFLPSDFVGYYDHPLRDPRKRVISFAFTKVIDNDPQLKAKDDAADLAWIPINEITTLAFDHFQLVKDALQQLTQNKIGFKPNNK
ncbi:MAG: NUDIX domain-containing protein [Bacteroidota bacterium]